MCTNIISFPSSLLRICQHELSSDSSESSGTMGTGRMMRKRIKEIQNIAKNEREELNKLSSHDHSSSDSDSNSDSGSSASLGGGNESHQRDTREKGGVEEESSGRNETQETVSGEESYLETSTDQNPNISSPLPQSGIQSTSRPTVPSSTISNSQNLNQNQNQRPSLRLWRPSKTS